MNFVLIFWRIYILCHFRIIISRIILGSTSKNYKNNKSQQKLGFLIKNSMYDTIIKTHPQKSLFSDRNTALSFDRVVFFTIAGNNNFSKITLSRSTRIASSIEIMQETFNNQYASNYLTYWMWWKYDNNTSPYDV